MMLGHNRKMLGAECMADMLEAYGVTHVFHVPAVLRKTFAVMETRTKIKRLHVHSEATAAYMADGYARASGKPGICMAQVIGALNLAAGLARRLARPFAGDRIHRRPRAEDQVPPRLSGGRRRAGVRAGDQVERHGRRREPLPRHGAAGVPRRHHRHARTGASAVPRQRRPGRRRRRRDGADGRAGVFARAAVPAGAGSGERDGGAEGSARARRGR